MNDASNMSDLEIAMREMEDTKEDLSSMQLPAGFEEEIDRIRMDMSVSPHIPLTVDMCKMAILAHQRAVEKQSPQKQSFNDGSLHEASAKMALPEVDSIALSQDSAGIMARGHALCPTDMPHLDRMKWMAHYFEVNTAAKAEVCVNAEISRAEIPRHRG